MVDAVARARVPRSLGETVRVDGEVAGGVCGGELAPAGDHDDVAAEGGRAAPLEAMGGEAGGVGDVVGGLVSGVVRVEGEEVAGRRRRKGVAAEAEEGVEEVGVGVDGVGDGEGDAFVGVGAC